MKNVSEEYINREEAIKRKPAELYHIWKLNEDVHYRYTSGDVAMIYNGNTYTPATIERSSVQYDTELSVSSLKIQAARVTTPIIEYLAINPLDLYWIEVLKLLRDQSPLEASVIFLGQIKLVRFKGVAAEVECAGFETYLQRGIPRFRYSPGCNWTLYDENTCRVDKTLYRVTDVVIALSADGLELTSVIFGTKPDDYFTFGYVEYNIARRMIVAHTGNTITLNYRIPDLVDGGTITAAYAGCNLSIEMCKSKFNNVDNFFGFTYIPLDNPAAVLK